MDRLTRLAGRNQAHPQWLLRTVHRNFYQLICGHNRGEQHTHFSFTISSTFCTVVLTAFPVKSKRTPRDVTRLSQITEISVFMNVVEINPGRTVLCKGILVGESGFSLRIQISHVLSSRELEKPFPDRHANWFLVLVKDCDIHV